MANYKRGRESELGINVKQIQVVVGARLEPAVPLDCESDALTFRPRCHRLVVPNVRKAFIYVVVIANQRRKLLKIVAY